MRRRIVRLSLFTVLIALLAVPLAGAAVKLAGDGTQGGKLSSKGRIDNRSNPLKAQQQRLLKKALEQRLSGKTHAKAVEVARGQYVQLAREGEYSIWTLPGEFADLTHNQIPDDRSVDNSTIWRPDFNRAYYMDMLFNSAPGANSMRNFYIEQSSGRFAVNGDVSDWVPVPGNGATYDDDLGGPAVWQFLIDSTSAWYEEQLATKTPAQIDAWLSQFDKRDRYDFDGDGDFNEPDGYMDTFQSVHAGLGNEDGGGVLGDAAIWSHSWYAWYQLIGSVGPEIGGQPNLAGGIQVGDSKYWIGDYTIQPENGGVGVFAHEYGHDLGLPDLYDTEGANDNAESFWTLMSDGSNISDGTVDIGSKPSHMGVWEKFQLGWLNYQVAYAGKTKDLKLGPAETNTKQAQGLFVVLPQKSVTTNIGAAAAGTHFYYSGAGNNLDNKMYKSFTLPANATLTAKVRYDIELDWDYAYVVVSTDGGATWAGAPTNLSTTTSPNGQNLGNGITGTTSGAWVDLTADLSAYGGNVLLGFRYWTDGAVAPTASASTRSASPAARGRRRDRCRLDVRPGHPWLPREHGHGVRALQPLLRGRVPAVPRLRHDPQGRTLLLRLRQRCRSGQQGRPLPVPGRPADQLLGHLTDRQQRLGAPRARPAARRRCPPEGAQAHRRRDLAGHPATRPSGSSGRTRSDST